MTDARLAAIRAEYRPYDRFAAFEEGYQAHAKRQFNNPHPSSVAAQAWDCGLECAARYARGDDPRNVAPDPHSAAGWLARLVK
jgi:hypothetical protein